MVLAIGHMVTLIFNFPIVAPLLLLPPYIYILLLLYRVVV
nr:MAG TPA: hypothetical protein [Caudoviricetes sp.]